MPREMRDDKTGTVKKVREHIILKNFWEYYVFDEDDIPETEDTQFALVMGFEQEMGYFSVKEIKPHIASRTNDLEEVMPAPGYSWVT